MTIQKKPLSERTKERLRQSHLGKKATEETKKKMSEAQKKLRSSKEVRERMSQAAKKNSNSGRFKKGQIPWSKGRKFSKISRAKMSEAKKGKMPKFIPETRKGKDSHLWKGGITPKNKIIRGSAKCLSWRNEVFERDNFTCQKTGVESGKLNAHHIQNFSEFPELRFKVENGITLSEKAHREFHKTYGKKKNTKEQLKEFLNS